MKGSATANLVAKRFARFEQVSGSSPLVGFSQPAQLSYVLRMGRHHGRGYRCAVCKHHSESLSSTHEHIGYRPGSGGSVGGGVAERELRIMDLAELAFCD